jgi:hypothetical protein
VPSSPPRPASAFQRNALAPGILAAAALFFAPAIIPTEWFAIVLYVVAIMALIVGWFAVQARQWWWVPVFLAVAIVWNPIFPLPFTGPLWVGAQFVGAVVFLVAGTLIKIARAPAR